MLARLTLALALSGFLLFNYAQYQGWSLFADDANAQALRPGPSFTPYHK
jgi:hypothetical protein